MYTDSHNRYRCICIYTCMHIYYIHITLALSTLSENSQKRAMQKSPAVLRIRSHWAKSFEAVQPSWSGSNSPAPQLKQLDFRTATENLVRRMDEQPSYLWCETPQIIHFNRVWNHYKSSILGVLPLFLETPIHCFFNWAVRKVIFGFISRKWILSIHFPDPKFSEQRVAMIGGWVGVEHHAVLGVGGLYVLVRLHYQRSLPI